MGFYNDINKQSEFNVELERSKIILELCADFWRFRIDKDFEKMITTLRAITGMAASQINMEEILPKIDWLEDNYEGWCYKDNNGDIIKISKNNLKIINKQFNEVYRLIQLELDEKGITKKVKEDPGKAMGKFDS